MSARRLSLVIGPSEKVCARLRMIGKEKAGKLARAGVWIPEWNHVRLYAACAEADEIGLLRYKRGLDTALVQKTLTAEFRSLLETDLDESDAAHVILCASQLGGLLNRPSELERLRDLFEPHFDRIDILAHVQEQARWLTDHYIYTLSEGRQHPLYRELELAVSDSWWDGALSLRETSVPHYGLFNDIQHPAPWLDFAALRGLWEGTFGAGSVIFRPLDLDHLCSEDAAEELTEAFGLDAKLGKVDPARQFRPEPAASLTRIRRLNNRVIQYMQAKEMICPREFWQQMRLNVRVDGPPIAPGSLFAISDHFKDDNAALTADFPNLKKVLKPDRPMDPWQEADPLFGYRATQYLAAFGHALRKNATPLAVKQAKDAEVMEAARKFDSLLPDDAETRAEREAQDRLLTRVKVNHRMVLNTQFKPHNNLGAVNEEELAPAFTPAPARNLRPGSSGNVIVGCMKNEAPYIVEWVAYHRAIGVDNFLIYTNDCTDGTDEVLGRLMEMGVVELRNNDNWKGNSPQQHALNQALKEPVIRNADWIIHIDVDEFINVRCGNGTLDDFFAAAPDATNVAMTWRLFGHNGVTALRDDFVIDQFDACAPKYCPKPHTVWGFKTMFRNIGAYGKISCHRPNKLATGFEKRVKWVNGSGHDMTSDAVHNGWRSSKNNVGYDLLQLNHYALRSAESFLIKRQRGRALHVDRSIGINYWIRMDWSDFRDITIKRNMPRLRAEYARLMSDPVLKQAHQDGFAWHKAKAEELHGMPEFQDLYQQALDVKLNETERVAYALSLDMES
ncbi:MAG: glycosyltransferase family 2 protein [Sulfitobacter sp.]|nr:glycosyltransferase family 2 protein [Sulfitobacter sp.]